MQQRICKASRQLGSKLWCSRNFATATTTSAQQPKTDMFCFQCEQTKEHKGCTTVGNCGKTPEVAALQDLLIHALKGLSVYSHHLRTNPSTSNQVQQHPLLKHKSSMDRFVMHAVFSTLTNVNFDADRFVSLLKQVNQYKTELEQVAEKLGSKPANVGPHFEGLWKMKTDDVNALVEEGKNYGVMTRRVVVGDDLSGMQELITYGIKGLCAYAEHAELLGQEDENVYGFVQEALAFLSSPESTNLGKLVDLAMQVGKVNYRVLELLDQGEFENFGQPTPTQARITPVPGKCILVSGHDLKDLEDILKQTEGKGINVYTHGELLPAHSYPKLKKYPHLVGNYGGAWQLQKIEFSNFPGAIVVTTNCLIEPRTSYKNRLFTRGAVGWSGVPHLTTNDYSPVIQAAQEAKGFTEDACKGPEKFVTVGFGHRTVLGIADKVVEAIQSGAIKRFFVIGGCDGAESERSYYKKLADILPSDAVILTLGCGKYRFNKQEFGNVPGTQLPRLLDMGQCNDSYSAIKVALALAQAFKTDVNSLPVSLVLSWFEQKAVAVLLTLLSLGVKNIRIGPSLPAFATPAMLQLLQSQFNLMPISDPTADLLKMQQGQ